MQTRCPECHTLFRVTAEQLGVAGGRVRCGECMTVFDAKSHEQADPIAPAPRPQEPDEDEQDVGALLRTWRTDAREAPVREESAIESLLHRRDTPAAPPPPRDREPPAPAPSPASSPFRDHDPLHEPALPPALARRFQEQEEHRVLPTVGWGLGSVVLSLSLILQYGYFHRLELGRNPAVRPWLESLCSVARCTLPLPRATASVTLLRKEVRSHGTRPGALVITGELANDAPFAQAYPDVEITFKDLNEGVVAKRRFHPAEYLLAGDEGSFPAGGRVGLRLEVMDPGKEAVGYEFKFL